MEDLLYEYLDNNSITSFEGERGVTNLERVCKEVCGYDSNFGGVLRNFFSDNPGAIEAVIEWIGRQHSADWKDNLECLVGPEEEDEVGDLAPPEETSLVGSTEDCNFAARGFQ